MLIDFMNETVDLAGQADDRAGFDVNEHPIYSLQVNLSVGGHLRSVDGEYTLAADQRIDSIDLLGAPEQEASL